jgi:hypothetical protein
MKRVISLRVWLLVGAGVVAVACGGDDDELQDGSAGAPHSGGTGATGGAGGGFSSSCTSPQSDPQTGLVACEEGYVHRAEAVACGPVTGGEGGRVGGGGEGGAAPPLPRAEGHSVLCSAPSGDEGGAGGGPSAEPAARCSQFYLGYCDTLLDGSGGGPSEKHCASGCITDEDCGSGFVCLCGQDVSPSGGVCRPSNCTTDADCGAGRRCASYESRFLGCGTRGIIGFACQTANDECAADTDCEIGDGCEVSSVQRAGGDHLVRLCEGPAACQ